MKHEKEEEQNLLENRDKTEHFMLQLRVVRAFKSTLEDLEDRRSIHSLRSLKGSKTPAMANLFHQNRAYFQKHQHTPQTSPNAEISIAVPQRPPLNINDFNARYMDDDGPPSLDERSDGQSKETRI